MSATTATPPLAAESTAARHIDEGSHLFGPVADFLCLGGATLLLIPLFWLVPEGLLQYSQVLIWTTFLAHFVNNPHFAASYQLFYRGFAAKGFSDTYPAAWRARYLFAGVAAPLLLLAFFAWCLIRRDALLLCYSVNLMFFTVGWHYVKQGYGMLMLDSVLKRRFFAESEKKLLLYHAYTVWLLSWLISNRVAGQYDYWGIGYYTFGVPRLAMNAAYALVAFTGIRVLLALASRLRQRKPLPPVNGLVAYGVSLYVWLLYPLPILVLIFPAMHSLQYLVVVSRFELNYRQSGPADAKSRKPAKLALRMAAFYALAMALGYFGFWHFPAVLRNWLPETVTALGGGVFLLAAWIFINVHHYFMDSVVWRKGNPETGKYLFR